MSAAPKNPSLIEKYCRIRNSPEKIGFQKTNQSYLVIGGNGFLGSHIVEALLARGETDITIFDITKSVLFVDEKNVRFIQGDLTRDANILESACKGKDVVFYTAALVNYWSNYSFDREKMFKINVESVNITLEICKKLGVGKFIFTSSCAAVWDANVSGMQTGDEDSLPYPKPPYGSLYIETKFTAEKLVLSYNDPSPKGMKTGAIRPVGGIYGVRDPLVLGGFFQKIETGETVSEVLPGRKMNYVYVENVAHAHLCLEKYLNDSKVYGKPYFICDNDLVIAREWHQLINKRFPQIKFQYVPYWIVVIITFIVHLINLITNGKSMTWSPFFKGTPTAINYGMAEYQYSDKRARDLLQYKPLYSMQESLEKTFSGVEAAMKK